MPASLFRVFLQKGAVCLLVLMICPTSTLFAANSPVPFIDLPTVPAVAAPGGPGFTLTVNGAGFVNGSVVNWNGNPRTTTFISAAQLTATIPATDIAVASTATITVTNPAPGGGLSNWAYFEVTNPVSNVTLAGIQLPNLNFFAPIVVDLNHDGKADLILHGQFPDGVHPYVALGNGDGTFQAPVQIQNALIETPPVALGDFNGDGNLDVALVTCCNVPSTISILLGNGDGTFQSPLLFGSQGSFIYRSVVVGDFNQDGNLDIVTNYTNGSNAGNALFLGNGDGTFQVPINSSPQSPQCVASQAADLNADGKLDLFGSFGTNGASTFFVQLGNGDGSFQSCLQTPGPFFLTSVALADINGDGIVDIIDLTEDMEPSFYTIATGVLLGNGDGTFTGAGTGGADGFPAFPPADFNGDGKLDFLVSAGVRFPPADDLSLVPGNGDGTFGNAVAIATSTGLFLNPLTQGDFNGDGTQDLLASDKNGNMWMFLQGSFAAGSASPTTLSFSQPVGTTGAGQAVTLTNTGSASLTLSSPTVSGTDAADFQQTNNCPASLTPGDGCQITVMFTPGASGSRSATLNIPSNGIGTKTVPLAGSGTDFSISQPSPNTVTVMSGQTAQYTFDVNPIDGFTGGVNLTCTGAPPGAKCLPALAMLNGISGIKVVFKVQTAAPTKAINHGMFPRNGPLFACLLFGFPLIVTVAGIKGRAQSFRLGLLVLMTIPTFLLPACGGGGGSGTPAGVYPMTVSGQYTSGGQTLTHSVTMTLFVQ